MGNEDNLPGRFQMEVDLLEAMKAEAKAADEIGKVKSTAEPMVRLCQVIQRHPHQTGLCHELDSLAEQEDTLYS
jgi:ligand-binding sensor protein